MKSKSSTVRRSALSGIALITAFSLLTACSSESAADNGAGESTEPVEGGSASIGISYAPTTLDPQLVVSYAPDLGVVETLVRQDKQNGTLTEGLASSWSASDDATSFTFVLRPGITFSDGSPLDATVVAENFNSLQALGPQAPASRGPLTGYAGAEAIDDLTVRIDFTAPTAGFLSATASPSLGIISRESLSKPLDSRRAGDISGTGPFVIESYSPGESVEVRKRPDYDWAPGDATHTGAAYLDTVTWNFLPESATRLGALTSGQVDLITEVDADTEVQVPQDGFWLDSASQPGLVNGLVLNPKSPILQDEVVRTAIQRGIDRTEVIAALTPNYLQATSVLSSTTLGYADQSDLLGHDPESAADDLDRAGWVLGDDGVRVKDGTRLSLDVVYGNIRNLELIKQQLSDIGVELVLQSIDPAQVAEILTSGRFDLFLRQVGTNDPDVLRSIFATDTVGSSNISQLAPDLVPVLESIRSTTDSDARTAAAAQAQQALVERGLFFPDFENPNVYAGADGLEGFRSRQGFVYDVWKAGS
ncbi:ABC transporter substrate-binding protein [Rhodococcoides kyotonense]|uniref:Peptide/nickel transport system substrate-binding protein n=1 Tax=Rhodococcoides kyotonense TaxID=398843 RepID=A0A239MD45_9NOCA|nr:ABC transporter substrate-binding protein [Rhodococcus kyotonensis]SNT39898.1 peptide/nickel transport system substrate-binding protein [Rhodococcus kyotonensis]